MKACITTISKKVWENIIMKKKTAGWLLKRYRQPDWCLYHGALKGLIGCWSLTSEPYNRSRKACKVCDCSQDYDKGKKPKIVSCVACINGIAKYICTDCKKPLCERCAKKPCFITGAINIKKIREEANGEK